MTLVIARTRRLTAALLLAAFVLAGCSSLSPDERAIRSTIQRYDEILADGYRSLNMNGMREVASQLQAEDEYIHMSSLAEGGVRLDPTLRDLRFVKVSVEGTSALAETRETWDYRHYSRKTGALVLTQEGLVYDLSWDLTRVGDGSWQVTDVRAISATATVPASQVGTLAPETP